MIALTLRRYRGPCIGLCLFGLIMVPVSADDSDDHTTAETPIQHMVVQPLEDQEKTFMESLAKGSFMRWVLPSQQHRLKLQVGNEKEGDLLLLPRLLPLDAATAARVDALPVRFDGQTFFLGDQRYDGHHLSLALRLPGTSPPTWLIIGHDLDAIVQASDRILIKASGVDWRRPSPEVDYHLREHAFSERSGRWQVSPDGTVRLASDERDDLRQRQRHYAAKQPIKAGPVNLWAPPTEAASPALKNLAQHLGDAAASFAEALHIDLDEAVDIVVEEDFVLQGRHLGDIGAARPGPDGRLHLVQHPDDLPLYRFALAQLMLRRAGVELPYWLQRGAALWLSEDWYGRPYDGWTADLIAANVLPEVDQLLAEEAREDSSSVLWTPIAAALIERLDGDTLGEKLEVLASSPQGREALLTERLRELETTPPNSPAVQPRSIDSPAGFRHGVSLAMANGLDIGYHAPGIDEQLRRLGDLGVDSVSLMPFAYQRHADQPDLRFLNRHPSSETDVGVIHAARRAHAQGFHVLWKPHIWLSRDSWPGDIAMTSEADWERWFDLYRRYILHHAILAQWTHSESFSIGVELGRTVGREAQWRHLIASVRRLYGGRLTYSGNWWADYDRVPFWDALDVIGVDAYFPLANEDQVDEATLREGGRRAAEELRAFAQHTSRPVLLTEVGFAARHGAWVSPHEEGGELSLEDQELAYRAFFEALGKPPWLEGVYVWKVFSHARAEGGDRPDFRFLGRPAEAEVGRYFQPSDP